MKNITKLKSWPALKAMGFDPINYKAHGKTVAVGASLREEIKDISGKTFMVDIITIEPHNYSDGKNYHITGKVKEPFTQKCYRYEFGRKVDFYEQVERINEFYKAVDLEKIVRMMNGVR